jgi:exodeoxyribonuclease V alpha subunit
MTVPDPIPRLANEAFANAAAPFLARGILSLGDVHVVDRLAALAHEHDVEVLLGLAFAVRAPRAGHVGVDLATVASSLVDELADDVDGDALATLPWPADPEAWHARTCASSLVGAPDASPPRPFVRGQRLLGTVRWHRYERRLHDAIVERANAQEPSVDGVPLDLVRLGRDLDALFENAPLQRLGALTAVLRPLAVLSGGPGTGKTFTVKKLLVLLHAQWLAAHGRPPRVALAAPTGKAAVRMMQAIGEGLEALPIDDSARAWLRAREATTIHRLLGFDPRNPTRFRHDRERRLPYDVVVVDEASMIDLALMCKLVEAVPAAARLVLLGDRNQLASVEAGSVLADLTAGAGPSGLRFTAAHVARLGAIDPATHAEGRSDPTAPPLADSIVHFRQPFRFDPESGIAHVARAIADGDPRSIDQAMEWIEGRAADGSGPFADVSFAPHARDGSLAKEVVDAIVDGYRGHLAMLLDGPASGEEEAAFHARVLDAFDRVRVLAAHRRGPLGVAGLNATIEGAIARAMPALHVGGAFWVGRPILVTENAYDVGRMNGDVGIVVARASSASGRGVRVAFPGVARGTVEYLDVARLPSHETVFAMTIHKSQGSQFEHPFVVLPARPSAVVTRELLYTAITRARRRVTIAAPPTLLRGALGRRVPRASELADRWWRA